MTKFEVGKRYKNIYSHRVYLCKASSDELAIVQPTVGGPEVHIHHISRPSWEEVKPKRVIEKWINCFENGSTSYNTRSDADRGAGPHGKRIACVHVKQEYEEGEGLT